MIGTGSSRIRAEPNEPRLIGKVFRHICNFVQMR